MGLLLGLQNTLFFVMEESIWMLLSLSPSCTPCPSLSAKMRQNHNLGVERLSQATYYLHLPPLPRVVRLIEWTNTSCALLIWVKICLLQVNIVLKYIFTFLWASMALMQYWIKSTFIEQQFYMPINTWVYRKIRPVMSWTYKIDKNWMIIWIAKEPFTLFKYAFKK